jgi:hypothetical protein
MSQKNTNKKNKEKKPETRTAVENESKSTKRYLTDQEKAWIIRERLARRPVIVWRYRNGKWNRRLIFMLALMVIALGAALYFLSRY